MPGLHFTWRRFDFSLITVEPVLFLYMLGIFMGSPTFQMYLFNKVCVDKYNETFCSDLKNETFMHNHTDEEDYVQSETSYWILKKNIAQLIPSCFMVVCFIGAIGDTAGRKIPVLMPIIGAMLSTTCYLVMSVYPSSKIEYFLIGAILEGFSGSFTCLLMSVYSYITTLAELKNRTVRVGILEAMTFLAGTLGVLVFGVMLDHTSYIFVFAFTLGCYVLAFVYAAIRLVNVKPAALRDEEHTCCDLVAESLKSSGRCVVKHREQKIIPSLILLFVVFIIISLGTASEFDVLILYTKRDPFRWSQSMYGYYKGLENFTRSLILLTVLPLCKKYFKFQDTTLGMVGLASKGVGLLLLALANKTWLVFLVVVFSMFQGIPPASVRSLASSLVERDEQGRLFGLIAAIESITSLLASLIFNELYPASLSFFPGLSFAIVSGLCCVGIGVMFWLHKIIPHITDYGRIQESDSLAEQNQVEGRGENGTNLKDEQAKL